MGAEIAFAALWLVSIPIVTWALIAGGAVLGGLVGGSGSRDAEVEGAGVGMIVGWLFAAGYFVLAVVKIVLHVVEVIRLI